MTPDQRLTLLAAVATAMTSEQRITLIGALVPVAVVVLGGIGWLIRHVITTANDPQSRGVEVMQGQVVPATALPDFLINELDEIQARARIYRDALIRAGLDPDDLLRAAGLIPPKTHETEGAAK